MWQRFTDNARKVVFYAQEEAQRQGSPHVSPEHLLLGVLREPESAGMRTLIALGVDTHALRGELMRTSPQAPPPGHSMTLTPASKRVIDMAYQEAQAMEDNYVGSEHLLLGLFHDEENTGQTLARYGGTLERAREMVRAVQAQDRGGDSVPNPPLPKSPSDALPFSPTVERALYESHRLASEAGGAQIEGRHVLRGLMLSDPGVAFALNDFGIDVDALHAALSKPWTSP